MYRFVVQLGNTKGPQAAGESITRYVKPKGPAEALVKMGEADRRARTLLDFARFPIPWPSQEIREDFARLAAPLHDVVRAVTAEKSALHDVVTGEMTARSERDR